VHGQTLSYPTAGSPPVTNEENFFRACHMHSAEEQGAPTLQCKFAMLHSCFAICMSSKQFNSNMRYGLMVQEDHQYSAQVCRLEYICMYSVA
jgi:hypothetical protein